MTTNLIVAACKLSYVCENKLLESSMVYTGKAIENTSVKYRKRTQSKLHGVISTPKGSWKSVHIAVGVNHEFSSTKCM